VKINHPTFAGYFALLHELLFKRQMADADTPMDYGASSYASRLTPRNEKGGGNRSASTRPSHTTACILSAQRRPAELNASFI
jgi:hypothetical protein